jgi:hypothetical protein
VFSAWSLLTEPLLKTGCIIPLFYCCVSVLLSNGCFSGYIALAWSKYATIYTSTTTPDSDSNLWSKCSSSRGQYLAPESVYVQILACVQKCRTDKMGTTTIHSDEVLGQKHCFDELHKNSVCSHNQKRNILTVVWHGRRRYDYQNA